MNSEVLNLLNLEEDTKETLEAKAEKIADIIRSGDAESVVEAWTNISKAAVLLDSIKAKIVNDAIDCCSDVKNAYNCELCVKEAGVKYDYSVSADWNAVKKEEEIWSSKRKAVETELKAASEEHPFMDLTESKQITSIPKKSTMTVAVKIL